MKRLLCVARSLAGLMAVSACLTGCEKAEVGYFETKRVDELLSEREVATVIDILKSLSESDRDLLVISFLPEPAWEKGRTLPVRELIATEQEAAERQRSLTFLSDQLQMSSAWTKAIAKHKITREQFCGLFQCATTAYLRRKIDPKLSLPKLVELSELQVRPLELDERTFSSLASEEQYRVLYMAVWLAIGERARQLSLVPDENVSLVGSLNDEFEPLLPPSFQVDVFAGLYPRPIDYGVPFNEGAVSDAALTWNTTDAIIGRDAPDDERAASVK